MLAGVTSAVTSPRRLPIAICQLERAGRWHGALAIAEAGSAVWDPATRGQECVTNSEVNCISCTISVTPCGAVPNSVGECTLAVIPPELQKSSSTDLCGRIIQIEGIIRLHISRAFL